MLKILGLGLFAVATPIAATAALAAPTVLPPDDSWQMAKAVWGALEGGNYKLACAMALIAIVAGLRWAAPKLHNGVGAWLQTDVGASSLVLVAALGSTLATAFGAGQAMSWHLLWTAGTLAVTAAGGYAFLKKLVMPLYTRLAGK